MIEQESAIPSPAAPSTFDRRAIPHEAVETRWTARDGFPIRRIDWLIPQGSCRGSLLFFPGRGDTYEKYLETLDYWHRCGWRVTAADWRGQSGSGRFGKDPLTGHIDDFSTWVDDLAAFWADWQRSTPGPHVLAAHSMGGHLVLRALAEGKVDPDAMVLSAPMLGFLNKGVPAVLMQFAAWIMAGLGDRRRPAWKWSEKPGQLPVGRAALLTHDPDRYADEIWWRAHRTEVAMGPGSWGWVERAYASTRALEQRGVLEAVQTPVLIIGASEDKLVSPSATRRAARRLPRGQLLMFGAEAAHEILREADPVRDRALAAIDDFLDRLAPRRD
jgi:lysophospholipase